MKIRGEITMTGWAGIHRYHTISLSGSSFNGVFLLFTTFDRSFEKKKAVANGETKPKITTGDIIEPPVSTRGWVHVSRTWEV